MLHGKLVGAEIHSVTNIVLIIRLDISKLQGLRLLTGCFTKRKMHEPRTSWQVVAKTNDNESKAVAEVVRVPTKLWFTKATVPVSM